MAPAGVFWAAARARVAFCCARGKGGGAIVLLGAKEGGRARAGEERGWWPVSGRRRALARTGGFWAI